MQAPEIVAPAYLWVPEHSTSAAEEAADLAATCGISLDPEQRLALDAILAENGSRRWAALEACVIAPRQNIKTFLFRVVTLADMYLFDLDLDVWTAHEFNTAMEAFRDWCQMVEEFPHLTRKVKKINAANGDEGIEFTSGQRLRFKARTKTGGRGLTGDRVILDEAFALQPAHMGALMPTMSAKSVTGNPQILYGSSAGLEGSGVLRSIRDRGRAGGDPSLVYVEWEAAEGDCATPDCDHRYGIEGCILDDRDRWRRANLALGRRIAEDFIEAERRSLPPAEFWRERLGRWDDPPTEVPTWTVIDEDAWLACLDIEHKPSGALSWAVDCAPDGRATAIGVSDGTHAELIEHRPGTAWAAERLVQLRHAHGFDEVVLDAGGPAGAILADLDAAGIPWRKVTIQEHAQACGALLEDVNDGVLRQIGQEPLEDAVRVAERRNVGDVWLWTRTKSAGDIAPLVCITLAHWAARQVPEELEPVPTPGFVDLSDYLDEE